MKTDGYHEAITSVDATHVVMAKRSTGKDKLQRKTINHVQPMTADSGFHAFLRAHFSELMKGKTISFTLAVAGNLDAYPFRARRIADTIFASRPAVRFRVEPDSQIGRASCRERVCKPVLISGVVQSLKKKNKHT